MTLTRILSGDLSAEMPAKVLEVYPTPPDSAYTFVFHAEILKGLKFKLHRLQLQDCPPLKHFRNVKGHRFADGWQQAFETEYSHHAQLGTFHEVPLSEAKGRILDLMWVFDYKFTAKGFLDRFKAWLVIRGD